MYVRFYTCDASAPILGVNDLVSNHVKLTLRNFQDSYLQQHGQQELLQYTGRHFFIPAIVTEVNKLNVVWQTVVQQEFFDTNIHYSQLSGILTSDIAIEDSNMEARPATSLRSPTTPSQQEVAQHNLTHMPYRSWCPICVQSKGRNGQHRRHQHQHSTIQLDYCFMHSPHTTATVLTEKPKNITILTVVETITGLCSAIITPRKGPTRHQTQHLKRFVMEHGFANSIIQTDGENAITELAQQAAQQLGLPTRSSRTLPSDALCSTAGNESSMGISSWTGTSQPTTCFSTMASSTQHLCHQPLLGQEQRPDILCSQLQIQLYISSS